MVPPSAQSQAVSSGSQWISMTSERSCAKRRRPDAGGEIQVQHLGEHPRRGQAGAERAPRARAHTSLLCQLTLRGRERRLARLELARGQLPQPAAGDIAVLAQQTHPPGLVEGDGSGAARVMHHFKLGAPAVGQQYQVGASR